MKPQGTTQWILDQPGDSQGPVIGEGRIGLEVFLRQTWSRPGNHSNQQFCQGLLVVLPVDRGFGRTVFNHGENLVQPKTFHNRSMFWAYRDLVKG